MSCLPDSQGPLAIREAPVLTHKEQRLIAQFIDSGHRTVPGVNCNNMHRTLETNPTFV